MRFFVRILVLALLVVLAALWGFRRERAAGVLAWLSGGPRSAVADGAPPAALIELRDGEIVRARAVRFGAGAYEVVLRDGRREWLLEGLVRRIDLAPPEDGAAGSAADPDALSEAELATALTRAYDQAFGEGETVVEAAPAVASEPEPEPEPAEVVAWTPTPGVDAISADQLGAAPGPGGATTPPPSDPAPFPTTGRAWNDKVRHLSRRYVFFSNLDRTATNFYAGYADALHDLLPATALAGVAELEGLESEGRYGEIHLHEQWNDMVRDLWGMSRLDDPPSQAIVGGVDLGRKLVAVHARDRVTTARALGSSVVRLVLGRLCPEGGDPLLRRPAWFVEGLVLDITRRYETDGEGGLEEIEPIALLEMVRADIRSGRALPLEELVLLPAYRMDDHTRSQAWSLYRFLSVRTPLGLDGRTVNPQAALLAFTRKVLLRRAPSGFVEAHYHGVLARRLGVSLARLEPRWRAFLLGEE